MANLFDLPEPVPQPSPTGTPPPAVGPVNLFDIPEPGTPSRATDELEQAAQAGSAALVDYAAKHPELDYDTVFSKYREVAQREQKSLSVVENPTASLQVAKGLAGAVAQIPGSLFRAVKDATGVAAQGLAGDDARRNAAIVEGVADMEAGTYKTWDVLRQAGRLVGGIVRANFGGELSEEDLRKRFDGDLQSMNRINKAVAVEDSMAADLAKGLWVAPGEINRERIQEVSEWTDITMLVPVGFGAKAAEKGVVKGMLRKSAVATVDTALHQLEKLGTEAAAKAAKAGATEATQQAAKRSPLLASAIAAGTTFATTGDPMWAAISALAGHQIAGKRGLATAVARKSIRPLAQFGTKALEITKPVCRSAMGGMVGMAPFALSAETPEEFGAILGTGAGVGVVGGSLRFAQNKLTPGSFFRTERPKTDLPKMEVLNFGTDPEADSAHRRAVSWLDNESHNFVETIRQFVKEQTGREVYVLEGADFDRVAADFGKPNRVQGFVTPDGLQSFIRVDNNAFGHESIGHLWFEALDPQSQKEILDGVQKYYRPEEIATFQKEYTDKLANGILLSQRERGEPLNVEAARAEAARVVGSEGYVPREIIAENASAILSSIPPSQFGQPLPFIRGLHLKMEGLAERLGLRNETNTPQTNLGITPSARLANTILNVAAASRLEADMSPEGVVPDMTQASAGNVPDMAQTPPTAAVNPPETTQGMRPVAPAPAETPATPTPAPVQPAAAPQAAPAAEPAKPGTVEWPVDTGFEPGRAPEPLRPGQPAARPVEKPIPQPVPAAQPPIGENQRRTSAQLNRLIGQNEQLSSAARQDIRTAVEANGGNEAVMANTYAAIQEAVKGGRENTPALRLKMRVAEADAGRINPLTREREQLQRDAGTRGEVVEEKLIVPFSVPQLTKKGTLTFTGFDLSRPFDTADRLFRFAKERGLELPYSRVDDPQLTTDLAAYTQNHANGYLGDGRAFPANLAARLEIRPTKGYVPVPISRERSQFLNVLMGNLNTSSERALSTARAVGGQAFQIDPAGTKFETNPLRYRLRELGAPAELLADRNRNSTTAVFRLDRIDSVEGATDLGFRQPNTLAVEAGFMPEVFENQEVPGMPLRYRGVWELAPGRRMRMFDALKDITDAAGRVLVGKFSTVDSSTLERIGFEFPELSDEPMQRREYSAFSPESPEFKKWFGDSKVVDEEGKPLKMYHGTSSEFSIFDPQQGGKNFGQKEPYVFLTSSREDGDLYARNSARKGGTPRTLSLFVKLENPYVIEENSDSAGIHTLFENRRGLKQEVVEALNSPEYDGVLVRDTGSRLYGEDDKLRVETIAIVKHPEQIKSATGNRGTYDPKNPDIRYMPETPEFKAWFGDWEDPKAFTSRAKGPVSFAVGEDRRPLKLYHATDKDFSVFETGRPTKNSWALGSWDTERHAIFTTPDPSFAEEYISGKKGGRVMPLYASIQGPIDLRQHDIGAYLDEMPEINERWAMGVRHPWELLDGDSGKTFVEAAKKAGYDGLIFREDNEAGDSVEVFAVFGPEQLKSATGNRGTYDPKNPDIRYMPETAELEKPAGADTVNPDEWFTPEEAARVKAAGFDLVEAARIRAAAAGILERSKAARNPGTGGRVVGVDTPAGESQADTVQFAREEGPLAESVRVDAPLKLIHWSGNAGLSRLDPAKLGKGLATARDRRGEPRTYFYVQGSEYGADADLVNGAGKSVYGATVAPDRIYDGDADPLGYYEQPNREKADTLLRDNGYAGIATTTPDNRRVVEMYEPVDVKPLKKDNSRFAPEKLPTKKAAEENIKRWNLSPEEAAAYRDFLDSQRGLDGATLPAEPVTDPDGRPGFNTEDGATTIRVRNLRYDLIQAPEIQQLRDRYQKEYDTKRAALEETRKAAPRDRKAALERRIAALDSWWETEGQNRWVEEGTDLLADRLTEEYHKSEKDPEVQAGIGWYSKMRTWLQKRFGAGIEQFSQLLGATSAQTPVDENFRQALDALTRLSRGDYDPLLQKFDEHVKKAEAEFPGDPDAFRKQVLAFDEFPTRSNGKKFNANSTKVLHALYGNWLELTEGPKTPNFAGNLSGRTTASTIDVWAARTAHRLLYENKSYNPETGRIGSKATRWRLQPSVETGVEFRRRLGSRTGGDFFFAQDAYQKAADRLGIAGDDLQAFMWFHEKDNWEKRGWTSKVGAKKSSFEEEAGKLDLDRYQSGVTTFTTPELHNSETFQKTLADLRDTIAGTEGLRYGRAQESKGLYGGVEEPTFDVEFVLDQGADPTGILRKVVDIGRSAEQYDVFVSRAVDPDHPNARPGLEIGFRKPQTWDFVKSITGALSAKGVDGFTVASDRRGRPIGVRAQYVPEITARWTDSSPLEVANFYKNAILWTEKAQSALASLSDDLQSEISYSNPTAFDTRVYGREEYSGAAKIQWGETRLEKELGRRKEVLAAARK